MMFHFCLCLSVFGYLRSETIQQAKRVLLQSEGDLVAILQNAVIRLDNSVANLEDQAQINKVRDLLSRINLQPYNALRRALK